MFLRKYTTVVRGILTQERIPIAKLARAVGEERATTTRRLADGHQNQHGFAAKKLEVEWPHVRRYNRAVAGFLRRPRLYDYLEAVAREEAEAKKMPLEEDPIDVALETDAVCEGVLQGFLHASPYLKWDYELPYRDACAGPNSLQLAINREWRRHLVDDVDGDIPSKIWIDELLAICSKYGCDLTPYIQPAAVTSQIRLRDESELSNRRARAAAAKAVHEALEDEGLPIGARKRLKSKFMAAYDRYPQRVAQDEPPAEGSSKVAAA